MHLYTCHSKFKYNSDNRTCYPSYTIYKLQYGQIHSKTKREIYICFLSSHKQAIPLFETHKSWLCLAIHYFWEVRLLKNKTPKPPIAKASITGMPIESISFIRLVLSALPWRSLSAECSRRRLLILSIWCIIWRWLLVMASICQISREKNISSTFDK